MAELDPGSEEWAALSGLLDEALELPPDERAAWIDALPPEHDSIRPRLQRLLSAASSPDDAFLRTIPKVNAGGVEPDARDLAPPPEHIGPYRVVRKLAEGGMGAVWLAERADGLLNRPVALKLPRGAWTGAGLADRMAREREILAALNHPNIARLYDAGIAADGQPYLALEYVAGRAIDEYVTARGLPIRARLELFLQVARAVAHAHVRLIVHRDLKPSNILVTDEGEVKLLDFGIAKLLDDSRGEQGALTQAGGCLFTPDYASPEQLAGEALGVATDVYSSGVLLYELLAGTRPYTLSSTSRGGLERAIAGINPRRPSEACADPSTRRALRGDLDTIVLTALKKRPEERYATIHALAEDIERHLRQQPVLARPDAVWYRVSKYVARNTVAVGAAALVLMAILSGGSLAAWQARVAVAERDQAAEVRDFLISLFRDASPYNAGGHALSAQEFLRLVKTRANDRLANRPALRVELLNLVGSSLLTLQDTDGAEEVLTQAASEGARRLGPGHAETLRARVLMTHLNRFRGRTTEARAELDRLIPVLRARGESSSEDLVAALKNQAHIDVDAGRYAVAESAAQEAVDLGRRALGAQHPETVAAVLTRAYVYQYSREPDASLPAAEEAYRLTRQVFRDSPKHPRIIEGRLLYGRALSEAGNMVQSVEELAQAVRDGAEVFGPSSRMVGFYSLPLAEAQAETGRVDDAIATARTAVNIVAGHARPESFRYAAAIHQRGVALLAARRAAEALPDLTRAADALQRTFPPGHAVTRWFQADLVLALARAGRNREAQDLAKTLVPASGPPSGRSAIKALYALGVARRLAGDAFGAFHAQEEALRWIGPEPSLDRDRMRALTESGLALLDLGRPTQAAASLEHALTLSRRFQLPAAPDRVEILAGLARARLAADARDPNGS